MTAKSNMFRLLVCSFLLYFLSGCAATNTYISKRNLDVQTRTSTAIFVEPVDRARRTIYVDVKSGVMEFDRQAFSKYIKEKFAAHEKGYQVVDDASKAQFMMQAYVLNLEKASPSAADKALHSGYRGGAVAAGAAAGIASGHGYRGAAGGAVAGGVGSTIMDAFVQDVTYMLVVDVQIKEKAASGVIVRKDTQISAQVSDAGTSTQRSSEVSNKKEYRTRIVTTANKANLDLEEAQDEMFEKTAYAISGFF